MRIKTMKKNNLRKIVVILLLFTFAFTLIPFSSDSLDAYAASKYWKKYKASLANNGTHVKLSWSKLSKKQKKKVTGIMVYRGTTKGNMTAIKRLSKNATRFTDLGCQSGTTYYYQIKTYKKVKKYYNTKAKKWQKKKPKKKYIGETTTSYPTKNPSAVVYIRTKKASPSSSANPGGTGESGDQGSSDINTITVTDYLGVTRTGTLFGDTGYYVSNDGNLMSPMARYDRTVDGEFTIPGGTVMWQKNGVTFVKSQLSQPRENISVVGSSINFEVDMYNGDPDKLSFEIQNPTITVPEYTYINKVLTPLENTYVTAVNNGRTYRLTACYGVKQTKQQEYTTCAISFKNHSYNQEACGFVGGSVNVKIKYDGMSVGAFSFEPNKNANSNGLSPKRQEWLDVALAAVAANGGKKSYKEDMIAIENYVTATFPYSTYSCIGGAMILETYSIYAYDEYGFIANPPDATYESHMAFFKNSDAANGIYKKWETQGYK